MLIDVVGTNKLRKSKSKFSSQSFRFLLFFRRFSSNGKKTNVRVRGAQVMLSFRHSKQMPESLPQIDFFILPSFCFFQCRVDAKSNQEEISLLCRENEGKACKTFHNFSSLSSFSSRPHSCGVCRWKLSSITRNLASNSSVLICLLSVALFSFSSNVCVASTTSMDLLDTRVLCGGGKCCVRLVIDR